MKKIYFFSLLLLLAITGKAQQYYPYSIGYTAGEQVPHNGAEKDTFKVSFSGGLPFAATWEQALPDDDGTNYLLSGMKYNNLYFSNTFDEDLFASKGYYGDYVELKWNLVHYSDQVTRFKIFRKKLGSTDDSIQVASLSADTRSWKDEYSESGVMYHYTLFAEGIFDIKFKYLNFIQGVGFRIPYGRISGSITYKGGSAVEGVNVIAETKNHFAGSSIYLNGTDAYLAISPKIDDPLFMLDTAMTFQMWVLPKYKYGHSVLFKKGNQYKLTYSIGQLIFNAGAEQMVLNFPLKIDTFFHVTAMKTADSLKLTVLYDEQTIYTNKKRLSSSIITPNNDELYIGYDGTSSYFKGYIDELRIWHRSFSEKEQKEQAMMYISGTEDYLTAYYRMNEGVGSHFYDLSHKGFSYNENHGYKHNTAVWSHKVPYSRQLAVKGITDKKGNYTIEGIPYSSDGSSYRFIPIYGVHRFEPEEQLLYMGPGSVSHSKIDFTDIASFPVKGVVYYKDTYFPVENVSIKVDGRQAVRFDGTPIVTDANGKFSVDVPIGKHFIQLEKYGHGFENDGRFPPKEGELFDFQAPYTFQNNFQDTTLVKLIGKVVGGPIQAAKPKGLGKSKNNIGNSKIILTTQKGFDLAQGNLDSEWKNESYRNDVLKNNGKTGYKIEGTSPKQIEMYPDEETGEFVAYLLPEKYKITSVVAGKGTNKYTYGDEFKTTLDLTNSHFFKTEIDSVKIASETIITPAGDTIYSYNIDSVRYKKNLDLIYRVPKPNITVTDKDNNVAFWEQKVKAKDGTEVTVVDNSGNPLTDWPIFIQRKRYDLKISVFERYINSSNGGVVDMVPVTDGVVEIQNAISSNKARQKYKINKIGVVNYSFNGGLANIVGDFTNSMAITVYTGNGGTIQTPWEYTKGSYTGPFKGYVLGGLPTGNNFVTNGPTKVDMILRDPPGSNSYSFFEKGQSVSKTTTTNVLNEEGGSLNVSVMLGGKVETFAGIGAGVIIETSSHNTTNIGFEHRNTWVKENTNTTTTTTTKRWQTSDDEEFVGDNGDMFIGHSTNIVYGKCVFIKLLAESEGTDHVGKSINGFRIGKFVGIRINPEFGTAFQYSQNHIKNYLIPNLQYLRNQFLSNAANYTSHIDKDSDDYAKNNTKQTTSDNSEFVGDSYSFKIPDSWPDDSLYTDTVKFYNKQIDGWIELLARNEKEKLEATLKENLSFDAGAIYENSITYDTTKTETTSFEWQVSPKLANETGFDVNKVGLTVNLEEYYNHSETDTEEKDKTTSVTFGYVLNDANEGDYFSVDVKTPPKHTGPVFFTRGGQSQCPYEDEVNTQYHRPGTKLSEATMQREMPRIACDAPIQVEVPEDEKAIFKVQLRNISETESDAWFQVSVDERTNQNGAKISLDGHTIGDGRVVFVPHGDIVNKIITVEKTKPDENNYEDIGIILHSVCQFDPSNNWPNIADTVKITARFKPVCSRVDVTNPGDLWVLNANTGTDLNVKFENYNLAHVGFEKIMFQYKPKSTSAWSTDKFFYVNKNDFDKSNKTNKEWINGSTSLNYKWMMESLPDREYDIRLKTTCANGTENFSKILTGVKDTKRPQIFGTPQPGDGILSPGDDVVLTFDEEIEQNLLLTSNFSVRGVLNGGELSHNTALYFDGIDDYLGVLAGVNLQDKSFAVEFWAKRDELNKQNIIFSQAEIELGFNKENQFYVKMGNTQYATSHKYDFTDSWIHFTMSYDYKTKKASIYSAHDASPEQHNAIELEELDFSKPFVGSGRMYIGKNYNETSFFKGFIHDFRIWEKSIGYGTANSIMVKTLDGGEVGLGGFWPMNEARGDYAEDLSRSHNAKINGAIWKVFPVGYAEVFDGNTSNLEIPTGSSVVITDEMDFTIEFWFNASDKQANTVLFSNGIGDGSDNVDAIPDIWNIGINDEGKIYAKNNGATLVVDKDCCDNEWHHLALVLKRTGNTTLFIDGENQTYKQSSEFGGLKGAKMTVGAQRHYVSGITSKHFLGMIDEFRVWKLARTNKLLDMDMSSKLSGDEKGLVAYYPFDKYDENLILKHSLDDCDISDITHVSTELKAISNSTNHTNGNVPNIKDARPAQNLAYSWVVNNDKINIKIDEPANIIEKCVIEFTVDRVEDLHENRMASPETWTAFIKQNTVVWNEIQKNIEKEVYEPFSFDVDVLNIGGVEQNFVISNLPPWLSANITNETLPPDSKKTITFTVNPDVNIGNYDVSIFLTSDFGYNEKLNISLKVLKSAPDWEVDPSKYQYSMSVVGQVKIDGILSTNTDVMVAAFVGDECRGVSKLKYLSHYDMCEVFLNIYSNSVDGEKLKFKIWDSGKGIMHENVIPEYTFVNNMTHGTSVNPVIIESVGYSRKIFLPAGWKWISFNLVNPYLHDVNRTLSSIEATSGDQVKGQQDFINYNQNAWTGSLANNGGFKPENMYMVKLANSDTLKLIGLRVNTLTTPVKLHPGWSWIGYTPQANISVSNALANINPKENDLIKGQTGFAIYNELSGWLGNLSLRPGEGYMYYNGSSDTVSLVYPKAGLKKKTTNEEKLMTNLNGYDINIADYQFNMSVTGKVFNSFRTVSDKDVVVAFVGDECRGIAKAQNVNDELLYLITIYSNTPGEIVSFKLLDTLSNEISEIEEKIEYANNAIIGNIQIPQSLTVKSVSGIKQFEGFEFEIHPNPASDYIYVNLKSAQIVNKFNAQLVNVMGKVVLETTLSKQNNRISVSRLTAGVYFIKIKTNSGSFIKKIILE